jgi:hypothetical protein
LGLRGSDSTDPAGPVNVVRDVGREVVVDDVEHFGRVDAARHEVGAGQRGKLSDQKVVENLTADSPVNLRAVFQA